MITCAELFVNYLQSKDLKFAVNELPDNSVIVDFPYKGKVTKCHFSGDNGEYLSLYLMYESIPEDKVADVIFLCNELNKKYKWVTFFVDNDNDIMLHDDAILSPESAADETLELMIRMVNIGEEIKPVLMKTIYA